MATSAAIFMKNKNGKFIGNEITNDGYIEISNRRGRPEAYGAGYMLAHHWQNEDEVKKLIKKNAIRNLGNSIEDSQFQDWKQSFLNKTFTFDEVANLGYSYIYIFQKDHWAVMNPCSNRGSMLFDLGSFLDFNNPDRFRDNEEFWNEF